MYDNSTLVIFILDRSGSMVNLTKDTIGGFNSFIEEQRKLPGEIRLTTVLFDHEYELLYNDVDLKTVPPLTEKEYYARGTTALLDAIGKTIVDVGRKLRFTSRRYRPDKVLVVITTDGQENSSKEFSYPQIKEMITHEMMRDDWQFIFLGANIDSFDVARNLGINLSANFSSTVRGTRSVYTTIDNITKSLRENGDIGDSWSKTLE